MWQTRRENIRGCRESMKRLNGGIQVVAEERDSPGVL